MKKLSHRNKIQKLVEIVRKMDTDSFVCDSVFECEGWEKYGKQLREDGFPILYCPFCGRLLDFDNWPRLRG